MQNKASQFYLTCLHPPIDGGHTGYGLRWADSLPEQPLPNLPGEDGGAVRLVLLDGHHHAVGRNPRLGAADSLGPDRTSLVIPAHSIFDNFLGATLYSM